MKPKDIQQLEKLYSEHFITKPLFMLFCLWVMVYQKTLGEIIDWIDMYAHSTIGVLLITIFIARFAWLRITWIREHRKPTDKKLLRMLIDGLLSTFGRKTPSVSSAAQSTDSSADISSHED